MRTVGVGSGLIIALSWMMVQFVQVSAEQGVSGDVPVLATTTQLSGSVSADDVNKSESELSTPTAEEAHGPALTVPAEMIAMFQQRKQDLERRENAVRISEGQLVLLKAEVEKILTKVEAAETRRLEQEKAVLGQQASPGKQAADMHTQQLGQLAKMYESMPAEEAAARIERMADRNALEILRLLKSKSAGAILAQMKVDRAAKLTEDLLIAPKKPVGR
jgi:flagellar motility protein MotE (MotC chaperone)